MAEHWSLDLYREIEDPNNVVLSSSQSVVLKDSHPKAIHHYLVVPKNLKIKNVFELSIDHLPLLDDMFQLAKKLIDSLRIQPNEFLIGFKLDPSMQLLNLHVISTDFKSIHLKSKRHWTNFHTKIFLPYDAAYDQLKNNGNIEHLTEDELNKARSAQLKCNKCDFSTTILMDLKKHIFKHWEETPVVQRTEDTAAHRNASLELPQSSSNVKPQPSLKERVEALNKMLETFFITTKETTPTASDTTTTTTTETILHCDMQIDQNVEPALNEHLGCDQETFEQKENVCERQQEQQNEALESSQNTSNRNPQPSLKERLEVLNKMLETVSIKTTETTD